MRKGAYKAGATSNDARRSLVSERWPGLYQRTNARGERVLEFDYYDETGRRRWQSLPPGATLKQAQAAREKRRVQRREGVRFAPALAPRIADAWKDWLDEASLSLRPRTLATYQHAFEHRIVRRLGRLRVSALDRKDVVRFIRDLQRDGLAAWTIRGTLVPLGLFLQWAEDQSWRTGNPVRELRRGERPKVPLKPHRNLTAEDLWKLVDATDEDRRAYVALLAFAGLRASEALGLAWGDVDLDGQVLQVRAQLARGTRTRVEPKTDRAAREIEIDDGLLAILRAWKLRSPFSQDQHFVVVTRSGTPVDHRAAGRCLDAIVRRAGLDNPGLPKITPHQLRYTFGSLLIDVGEATSRVSRLMGHANEAITGSVYAHEIERRDNAERTRASLRAAFGSIREAGLE